MPKSRNRKKTWKRSGNFVQTVDRFFKEQTRFGEVNVRHENVGTVNHYRPPRVDKLLTDFERDAHKEWRIHMKACKARGIRPELTKEQFINKVLAAHGSTQHTSQPTSESQGSTY